MFSFLQALAGVKGEQLGQDIVEALVALDPESASQAQLEEMEKDLDKAGAVIQKLSADYDRERREYDAVKKRYDQLLAAAEVMQRKLDNPATPDKGGIEASMAKLVTQLEQLQPEVAAEQKDVDEVRALIDQAQTAYREKAEALTKAKQELERAKRDMVRATQEQERAAEKAQRAAEVSGLRSNKASGLTVATDAMRRRTDEARAVAEAAKLKAETLGALANPNTTDPHIADALKEVQGGASVSGLSVAERLAKLKG